jgi:hypothetical protein
MFLLSALINAPKPKHTSSPLDIAKRFPAKRKYSGVGDTAVTQRRVLLRVLTNVPNPKHTCLPLDTGKSFPCKTEWYLPSNSN